MFDSVAGIWLTPIYTKSLWGSLIKLPKLNPIVMRKL